MLQKKTHKTIFKQIVFFPTKEHFKIHFHKKEDLEKQDTKPISIRGYVSSNKTSEYLIRFLRGVPRNFLRGYQSGNKNENIIT